MFISSLTESPIISIIFALVVNIFVMISGSIAGSITVPSADVWYQKPLAWIVQQFVNLLNGMDFVSVLDSFGKQAFAIKDIVYFVSITVAFIFLTERSLEKRRWS